jgi:hypothetical protein
MYHKLAEGKDICREKEEEEEVVHCSLSCVRDPT